MSAMQTPELFPVQTSERHPLADKVYLIEEAGRKDELMPIMEDEFGTYIMNSKDLRAIQHVARLTKMGIDSLKIEGRTKSHYYVARTAQLYRAAINDAVAGREFDASLYGKLEGLANRGYTDGFYMRHPNQNYQNYLKSHSVSSKQQFVGEVVSYDKDTGLAKIQVKNKFILGDKIEVITPAGNQTIELSHIESLDGDIMPEAPGGGYTVRISLPDANYDKALLARNLV
jgi:putative protease